MPIYTFENIETGEQRDFRMTVEEYVKLFLNNPYETVIIKANIYRRIFSPVSFIMTTGSLKNGRIQ